jgi:hypothetical protein
MTNITVGEVSANKTTTSRATVIEVTVSWESRSQGDVGRKIQKVHGRRNHRSQTPPGSETLLLLPREYR